VSGRVRHKQPDGKVTRLDARGLSHVDGAPQVISRASTLAAAASLLSPLDFSMQFCPSVCVFSWVFALSRTILSICTSFSSLQVLYQLLLFFLLVCNWPHSVGQKSLLCKDAF